MKKYGRKASIWVLVLIMAVSMAACGEKADVDTSGQLAETDENVVAKDGAGATSASVEKETGSTIEPVENADSKENITTTNEDISANLTDHYIETVPWEDLDGNGVQEYLVIENDASYGSVTMYFNEEPIYKHEEELRIVSVHEKEYLDLDKDGEKEIFVSFMPAVNSMPLEEWFALKQRESGWELMEMQHYGEDMLDNGFPINVTLQEKDFQLLISCEGCEKTIPFDATAHYAEKEKEKEFGDPSYDAYMEGDFEKGSVVGGTCAWGVWNIAVGTYEGQTCLIAEHGLQGPGGKYDFYGCADVYFNYDENAQINILNLEFRPNVTEKPAATGTSTESKKLPELEELEANTEITWDNTIIPLPMNATVSVDLDGDGVEELVNTTICKENALRFAVPIVRVNDYVFDEEYMNETARIYMDSPDVATWYLFDLDVNDGYKEIGLYEDGPSGDPWVTLLRYHEGQLREIGGFSDKPIDDWSIYHAAYDGDYLEYVKNVDRSQIRIQVPGDGTVYARQRMDVMETNFAEGLWKLKNAESFEEAVLELELRDMYEFEGYGSDRGEYTPTVRDTLQVFTEPDFEAEIITLPQGENIDIYRYYPIEERLGWVQIAYHDRESFGWIFVTGYDSIYQVDENGEGVEYAGYDLIKNLSYVD